MAKQDRNRKWCEAYRLRGQREINKAKRLARHLRKHPFDLVADTRLRAIFPHLRKRAGVLIAPEPGCRR